MLILRILHMTLMALITLLNNKNNYHHYMGASQTTKAGHTLNCTRHWCRLVKNIEEPTQNIGGKGGTTD